MGFDILSTNNNFKSHFLKKRLVLSLSFFLFFSISACHKTLKKNNMLWDSHSNATKRRRLVADAYQLKRARSYQFEDAHFSYDCSGYIASILHRNGLLTKKYARTQKVKGNGVSILYQFIEKNGSILDKDQFPKMGDIVFFSNTYDRNRDGKNNDVLSHIGIIENVSNDGQITFLHHSSGKVRKSYLNNGFANQHKDKNKTLLNSFLRRRRSSDPSNTKYLAAQLVHSYGSLILK
ncbi:C40 family peptidase [bacterium]|nr:C40 family peptidase [bacterium]